MIVCRNFTNGVECLFENRDNARFCARCGSAINSGTSRFITVKYRVIEKIGSGGSSDVYKVASTQDGSIFAIKEITMSGKDVLESVRLEFNTVKDLNHQGIPKYFEFILYDDKPYIVMEFIPGRSLFDIIKNGPVSEKQMLLYAENIFSVLEYLHNLPKPVTHRDIKPENIIITPSGEVKIIDFGIMKQGRGRTLDVNRRLSDNYAPIEQWDRRPGGTNHKSDIYSLGATIYHAITGFPPPSSLSRSLLGIHLVEPHLQNNQISLHISRVILKAMSIEARDRYKSISQFRDALLRKRTHNNRTIRMNPSPSSTPPSNPPPPFSRDHSRDYVGQGQSSSPSTPPSNPPPPFSRDHSRDYVGRRRPSSSTSSSSTPPSVPRKYRVEYVSPPKNKGGGSEGENK